MHLSYRIVLVKEEENWWAYVPDLPGVYGMGDTEEKARKDLIVALKLYMEDAREDGQDMPVSHIKKIETGLVRITVPA